MLIVTRESDQTLKLSLEEGVDPNMPVGEVFAEGEIVLEETQVGSVTAPSAPESATTDCDNTNKELAEMALEDCAGEVETMLNQEQKASVDIQFSLPAAACQRIRKPDYPRRILGPAAAGLQSKAEEA
jgi:hypothetical protein